MIKSFLSFIPFTLLMTMMTLDCVMCSLFLCSCFQASLSLSLSLCLLQCYFTVCCFSLFVSLTWNFGLLPLFHAKSYAKSYACIQTKNSRRRFSRTEAFRTIITLVLHSILTYVVNSILEMAVETDAHLVQITSRLKIKALETS